MKDIENAGKVYLRGGKAKRRTYYVDPDKFVLACRFCGSQNNQGDCYRNPIPNPNFQIDTSGNETYHWMNIPAKYIHGPHEFTHLPPEYIDVPLSLTNDRHARYQRTNHYIRGLRVYDFTGLRTWRLTPKEWREEYLVA